MPLQRIYPDRADLTAEEATSGLRLGDLAPPDRPYLALNMISSADGRATIEGRTRALGDETDHALFHGLRTQADAVMAGAGTVRIERYGRIVRDPALRERRAREGLEPDPVAVIVSGALNLPSDLPLLQDPDSRVVVVTRSERQLRDYPATIEHLQMDPQSYELGPSMRALRSDHGVRSVLCEGGPTLNRTLLAGGLVDELFLSLAPKLAGGSPALTIVAGDTLPEPVGLELRSCLEAEGYLYLRYAVGPAPTGE